MTIRTYCRVLCPLLLLLWAIPSPAAAQSRKKPTPRSKVSAPALRSPSKRAAGRAAAPSRSRAASRSTSKPRSAGRLTRTLPPAHPDAVLRAQVGDLASAATQPLDPTADL